MPEFVDQIGRRVSLDKNPSRVVSLVPSQTELIARLSNVLAGRTKFCIHPDHVVYEIPTVGGTKNVAIQKVIELNPDLIIANKEENDKDQINELARMFPVWVSDVADLSGAMLMIDQVGRLIGRPEQARAMVSLIKREFNSLPVPKRVKSCIYVIWKDPLMCAGVGTFISSMLDYAGFRNVIEESRYPEISAETMQSLNPEVVLLSSEPYPFKSNHIEEFQRILPNSEVRLVDGEMFSWYGSRLQQAPAYFKTFLEL